MNKSKYPDGYLPKIAYHMLQGNKEKVQYFVQRQNETYGPLTNEDQVKIAKLWAKLYKEQNKQDA